MPWAEMRPLSAERASQLPWGFYERARYDPPLCRDRGQRGEPRGCHLCGAPYLGGDENLGCGGGDSCPRHYGYRRRHLEWFGGHWVPKALVKRWSSKDASAAASAAQVPDTTPVTPPPPGPVAAPPPSPLLPGPAGSRGPPLAPYFKAAPTTAEVADFDTLLSRTGPVAAFKAAPAGCVERPSSPPAAAQRAQLDASHLRIDAPLAFEVLVAAVARGVASDLIPADPPSRPVARPSPAAMAMAMDAAVAVATDRRGTTPPADVAPPVRPIGHRSRSPRGGARLFAAAVAGVHMPDGDDCSDDEVGDWDLEPGRGVTTEPVDDESLSGAGAGVPSGRGRGDEVQGMCESGGSSCTNTVSNSRLEAETGGAGLDDRRGIGGSSRHQGWVTPARKPRDS